MKMSFYFKIKDRIYFATSPRKDEIAIIKQVKPPRLLISFALWSEKYKDKCLKRDLIDKIGYTPESIIFDCGACTFGGKIDIGLQDMIETYKEMIEEDGKKFSMHEFAWWWFGEIREREYLDDKEDFTLFEQYLHFLCFNQQYYDYCLAFDSMGDNETGMLSFQVMQSPGLNVIPVFQAAHKFGERIYQENNYESLDFYASKTNYIALGGTAFTKIKGYTKKHLINIIRSILDKYPHINFHLLGTLDTYIMDACPDLYSVDGQSWLIKTNDKGLKISLSERKIREKLEYSNQKQLEITLFTIS
jgi:hypothetical protein